MSVSLFNELFKLGCVSLIKIYLITLCSPSGVFHRNSGPKPPKNAPGISSPPTLFRTKSALPPPIASARNRVLKPMTIKTSKSGIIFPEKNAQGFRKIIGKPPPGMRTSMIRNRNDKFNHPPRSFISHGPQPSKFSNTHGNTLNNVNSFKIVHNNNNLVNPLNAYNKNNSKISKEINPPKSPMHPKKESIYNNFEINRAITREFDNTLNPADFGPVIYEPIVASEFDDNSDDIFQDFDKKSPDSDFDFTPSHRHHFPTRPSAFTPSKAAPFSFPKKSDNQRSSHFRPVYEQETCDLYTEDICLETDDYPRCVFFNRIIHSIECIDIAENERIRRPVSENLCVNWCACQQIEIFF